MSEQMPGFMQQDLMQIQMQQESHGSQQNHYQQQHGANGNTVQSGAMPPPPQQQQQQHQQTMRQGQPIPPPPPPPLQQLQQQEMHIRQQPTVHLMHTHQHYHQPPPMLQHQHQHQQHHHHHQQSLHQVYAQGHHPPRAGISLERRDFPEPQQQQQQRRLPIGQRPIVLPQKRVGEGKDLESASESDLESAGSVEEEIQSELAQKKCKDKLIKIQRAIETCAGLPYNTWLLRSSDKYGPSRSLAHRLGLKQEELNRVWDKLSWSREPFIKVCRSGHSGVDKWIAFVLTKEQREKCNAPEFTETVFDQYPDICPKRKRTKRARTTLPPSIPIDNAETEPKSLQSVLDANLRLIAGQSQTNLSNSTTSSGPPPPTRNPS